MTLGAAAVLLAAVLAWLLVFLRGLVRGYARRGGWWRAGRIAGAAAIAHLAVGAAWYRLMNSRTVQVLGDHIDRVDTTQTLTDLRRFDARAILVGADRDFARFPGLHRREP